MSKSKGLTTTEIKHIFSDYSSNKEKTLFDLKQHVEQKDRCPPGSCLNCIWGGIIYCSFDFNEEILEKSKQALFWLLIEELIK